METKGYLVSANHGFSGDGKIFFCIMMLFQIWFDKIDKKNQK